MTDPHPITPQMLVWAYSRGMFPMAESRKGPVSWYSPDPRAILPLEGFKVSHSLRKRVRQGDYSVTFDRAFERVIRACAEPREATEETWISEPIIRAYVGLHERGMAHSVEAWALTRDPGTGGPRDRGLEPELVGGLYGVSLGGAFFGESMFSRADDASKVCLVHLVDRLKERGYALLDAQISNPHMEQFGVVEVPRTEYLKLLGAALKVEMKWE